MPGWVTLSITEGTIAAGDSMDVTVTLDVKTLAGCGLHEASLLFEVVGQDLVETRDIKVMINPTRLSGHWRLDETEGTDRHRRQRGRFARCFTQLQF